MTAKRAGGGVGTNQYQIRGQARVTLSPPVSAFISTSQAKQSACHPDTSVDVLAALAQHLNVLVRYRVAANPSTPVPILADMVKKGEAHSDVLSALARRPDIQSQVLVSLANCKQPRVRWLVAQHPCCPSEALVTIVTRGIPMEAIAAALRHDNMPINLLRSQLLDKRGGIRSDPEVVKAIVTNRFCPEDVLVQVLGSDQSPAVRMAALNNPSTPEHLRAIVILGK